MIALVGMRVDDGARLRSVTWLNDDLCELVYEHQDGALTTDRVSVKIANEAIDAENKLRDEIESRRRVVREGIG